MGGPGSGRKKGLNTSKGVTKKQLNRRAKNISNLKSKNKAKKILSAMKRLAAGE